MAKDELVESQDDRDDVGIFIHSELDDYGLNPLEFRVYGRLARRAGKRGTARQSVPHMAAEFGVHKRSVQRALRLLTLCGLTDAQIREGRPTIYRLNPRRKWRDPKDLTMIREYVRDSGGATLEAWAAERAGSDPASLGVRQEEPGGATPQTYEGTPVKVLSEGTPLRARNGKQPKPIRAERFILPPDSMLELTEEDRKWLKENAPYLQNVEVMTAAWYDKWAGNQSRTRTIEEWKATWRSFMRNCSLDREAKMNRNGNGQGSRPSLSPEARARKEAELRERMTGQRA